MDFRLFVLMVLLLTFLPACRTMTEGDAAAKCETTGGVSVVAVQYVASVGNAGAETVEVLIRNGTGKQVSLAPSGAQSPVLDGSDRA